MSYTSKQRKAREYLLDNIDRGVYIEALHDFVHKQNSKYYSVQSSHAQGYALNGHTANNMTQYDLFKGAIEYAGYKQDKADRTWLSVQAVYNNLLNVF